MIHKIEPHKYYPEFRNQPPDEADYLLLFDDNQVILPKNDAGLPYIPDFTQAHEFIKGKYPVSRLLFEAEYLFSIDEKAFYRININECGMLLPCEGNLFSPNIFRTFQPEYMAFAGITACQINRFRMDRKFCGRCGHPMERSTTERAMVCPDCGMIEYPKISPAVITAIVNGDKLLLTKYAGGSYRSWALVAGFVEVGETFKGAVRREVMEEVGLKVKDITYYKSQPWSFSDSAMIGFFARLDGEDTISLQEEELSTAQWFSREDIPDNPSQISIGQEMIAFFKNGGNPFSHSDNKISPAESYPSAEAFPE